MKFLVLVVTVTWFPVIVLRRKLKGPLNFVLHQTRLQAQAAGIPYQGICSTTCFESGTVCTYLFSFRPLCGEEDIKTHIQHIYYVISYFLIKVNFWLLDCCQVLPDMKSSMSSARSVLGSQPTCHPGCGQYKGTFDVLYKVARQVGGLFSFPMFLICSA